MQVDPVPAAGSDPDAGGQGLSDDGPSLTGNMVAATWGLFVGLAFLLAGAGLVGSLVGVRSELAGFSTVVSGLIGAAYYGGFLIGTRLAFGSLARVGHVRVFAALAATGAAAVLFMGVVTRPTSWIAMRFVIGLCMAGTYVTAESWLNEMATNENRGRLLAWYMVVTTGAWGVGQALLGIGHVAGTALFAGAAILFCMSVVPVALSETSGPGFASPGHISLRELAKIVPSGVGSALIVGVTHGALSGMGAVYATAAGLSAGQVAIFMTAPMLGGMLFQYPISAASDDVDRRVVALAVATAAAGGSVHLFFVTPGTTLSYLLMLGVGGFTYPLYALAGAYTNDWTPPDKLTAANSQLVTIYGIGALVGPLLASAVMSASSPRSYFAVSAGLHVVLIAFLFYRILAWRRPLIYTTWREVSYPARVFFLPATVITYSRRLRPPKSE